jgi:hypothetical protein
MIVFWQISHSPRLDQLKWRQSLIHLPAPTSSQRMVLLGNIFVGGTKDHSGSSFIGSFWITAGENSSIFQ